MNNDFEIAERKVGKSYLPLIIAELGINHEGSLKTAFEMVDAAARAGVELVKHQTHIVDDEMSAEAKKIIPANSDVSIYEIMKRCALDEEQEYKLKQYVESKGMIFISTPFSRAAALRLKKFDIPAYKIGSGECNNLPLIDLIASFGKPMIVSTGMNTLESVKKTVAIIQKHGTPLALMHTTNLYPTPNHLVRLGAMEEMMDAFPDIPIGLSDHTLSNHACLAAVALGASILERHFTDSMKRSGPDIICSMDELSARQLLEDSKIVHSMLGGKKDPTKEEQVTIDFAFATVVTIKEISKGEPFTEENLWVKRPGTGTILAEHYDSILGKISTQNLPKDHHLKLSNIQE
jgi:N-acetylneuraminate synthase